MDAAEAAKHRVVSTGAAREQSECWTDGIVYHKLAPSSSDFKLECDSFKFLTAGSPP